MSDERKPQDVLGSKNFFDTAYAVRRKGSDQISSFSVDYTSGLANKYGLYISITAKHIKGNKNVSFKALLSSYQENLNTDLVSEKLVGHYEPLRKISGVERVINIGLKLQAHSITDARDNLDRIKMLVRMMYPSTTSSDASGVTQQYVKTGGDPLFAVHFMNLITDSTGGFRQSSANPQTGYIDNVNYDFDLAQDFYVTQEGYTYPKLINLTFTFYPLHEVSPSWNSSGAMYGRKNFPFATAETQYDGKMDMTREEFLGTANTSEGNPVVKAAIADDVTGGTTITPGGKVGTYYNK